MKLVYVEWKDACFNSSGWVDADSVDTARRFFCYAAGFLVKDDGQGLVLAVDFDPETNKWRGLTFIPKGMVKRVKVFAVK
jgi:hypothetical protein